MKAKLFEVRDRSSFIPVVALSIEGETEVERWLLRRAGYKNRNPGMVIMFGLEGVSEAPYSPYHWGNNRSRLVAHKHIAENWDTLESGAVIDVEYILGETSQPKKSERETMYE